ncbi:MAG: YbaK/EbsC family protein [Gammaproteobacteria bacterium]|jgi:Ala-tRNA(Pro) deacylase
MAIAETVRKYLARNGVDFEPVPHPKTYSSRETAQATHVREDHIAKAVLLKDRESYALVVIPGSNWVKLDALLEDTGREWQLANEDEVDKLFVDCKPGAIPPLGPAYDIHTYLDDQLLSLAKVYFEAGDHIHLVEVSGEGFQHLLKGVRHGHYSHNA